MNEEAKLAAVFPMLAESDLPIEELDIEVASRNSLRRSGVHTVAQLLQLTHTELVTLFPNRNLPFYSEIIFQLTCLAQPRKAAGECTVTSLPDDVWEGCKMKTFNFFQTARIWADEQSHTGVIAELINPESQFHDVGGALLKKLVEVLGLPVQPEELSGATVNTEAPTPQSRRIDMVIETKSCYLPFEVKIWAKDQKKQLQDYYKFAEKHRENKKASVIYYLTPNGHVPDEQSKGTLADSSIQLLSFQAHILPWLNVCMNDKDIQLPEDVREIMRQLRDNIQGYPGNGGYHPLRHPGFSKWKERDFLDDLYCELSKRYNLPWTECSGEYITFTLRKEGRLEFALRIKKEGEDAVSLHLICGLRPSENGTPDYRGEEKVNPYILQHFDEYERLLSGTFANRENVNKTADSKWDRMKIIHCKKGDGDSLETWAAACLQEIEMVFSWLQDDVKKERKKS